MLFKFLNFIFIFIFSLFYVENIKSQKSSDIILKRNNNQIPCLINQKCDSCQSPFCVQCDKNCQHGACKTCKFKYKTMGAYQHCVECDNKKIRIFNSFNRNCGCYLKKNICKMAPYCDACTKRCNIFCNPPRSIFVPRSQGSNTAKDLVGWLDLIYAFRNCNYITTAHSCEYTQSFRDYRIAQYLFGSCNLNFAGSQIKDRSRCQLIADYFGLSPKYQGVLRFNPMIENFILQNQVFFGLNNILCGLYFRMNMPLVWTMWNLRAHLIKVKTNGCPDFNACYMSKKKAKATCCIFEALSGEFTFGQMQQDWHYGRFSKKGLTKFGAASIDLITGYNYILTDQSHFGFYIQATMPTGNKPNSKYIFEPIIGNSKHFELGGGLTGHLTLWTSGSQQALSGYIQGNVTHMFKNVQLRSFDFCKNGPLSRYMLLKEYKKIDGKLVYINKLINAINYTTRPAEVVITIKGDFSALLAYRSSCINMDLGYNFYGQNKEHVKLVKCDLPIDKKLFGIKGTQDVCAIEYSLTDNFPIKFKNLENKITVNSTESGATICSSGKPNMSEYMVSLNNGVIVSSSSRQSGVVEGGGLNLALDSSKPHLVSVKDLDISSGTAGACVTHKVFADINYFFSTCSWFGYYFGVGGEVEVEALACNEQTSLNQWGIWLKAGIDF